MNCFTFKKSFNRSILKTTLLSVLFVQIYFFSSAQVRSRFSIQLLLNTNAGSENTADGVVAFFADNFSTEVGNEDSYKWTNLDENLAINSRGTLLSIEGRPTLRGSDTLHLVMWTFRQKSYFLEVNAANFSSATKAFVKDNYLHTETAVNLSSGTLLPFTITGDSASYAANRFAVIFKNKRQMPKSIAAALGSAFTDDNSVTVSPDSLITGAISLHMSNHLKKGKYEVSVYSKGGERVYSGFIVHNGNRAAKTIDLDRRIPKGMYNLLLTHAELTIKKSIEFQ